VRVIVLLVTPAPSITELWLKAEVKSVVSLALEVRVNVSLEQLAESLFVIDKV
jgi:hypothetical protein